MITGHLGLAAALRSTQRARATSLGFLALLLASIAPDVVDALYVPLGICNPYGLYSHTLHAVVLQAAVIGGATFLVTGSRGATLMFALVILLHIAADAITGIKLLVPGGEMIGLGLYAKPVLDFLIETPIAVAGWWLLRRSGRGPAWAVTRQAIFAVVLLQLAIDAAPTLIGYRAKPNRCLEVPPPTSLQPRRDATLALVSLAKELTDRSQ